MIPKDDFGHAQMMAILDYKSLRPKQPVPALDPVDEFVVRSSLGFGFLAPTCSGYLCKWIQTA